MANGILQFGSVEVENFRSYAYALLNFEEGTHLIRGHNMDDSGAVDNGAGKTTIANGIYWAITGTLMEPLDAADDVINLVAKKDCRVALRLNLPDGSDLVIVRHRAHSQHGNSIHLFLDDQDITAHRVADNQKKIAELVDVDPRLLKSVILMDHKLGGKFSDLDPKGRVALLESIRDFTIWDNSRANANNQISIFNAAIELAKGEVNKKSALITTLREGLDRKAIRINGLKSQDVEAQRAELEASIEKSEAALADKTEKREALLLESNEIDEKIITLDGRKSKLQDLKTTQLAERNSQKSALVQEANDINVDYQALVTKGKQLAEIVEKNSGACPTCLRPLDSMSQDEIDKHKGDLANLRQEAQEVLDRRKAKQAEADAVDLSSTVLDQKIAACSTQTLTKRKGEIKSSVFALDSAIKTIQSSISAAQSDMAGLIAKAEQIADEIKHIEAEVDDDKDRIDALEAEVKDHEEKIKQNSSDKTYYEFWYSQWGPKGSFRPSLLNKDISFVNRRLKVHSKTLFENFFIQLSVPTATDRTIRIDTQTTTGLHKKPSMLSAGELKRVDMAVQFSIYDLIAQIAKFRTDLLFCDEIFDALDVTGVEKALELIEGIDATKKYVISHNQYLKSQILSHIIAVKEGDISRLVTD